MAQQTTVVLIDDIDGVSEADDTVRFTLDGTAYEIDLTAAHVEELRAALAPFIAAARKAGRTTSSRPGRKAATGTAGPSAEEIRVWAKSQKLKVSERGRISAELRDAYTAAHP